MKQEYKVNKSKLFFKLLLDIIMATISLIIFSPIMLVIAIFIKIDDPSGPIVFAQERIGYKGKPFTLYKFRSMRKDAENNRPQLCQENDDRLTKVGRFLRNHHLDEFPQLWNVIRGEMSFVGPRPERKFFIDQIIQHNADYAYLYQVRPGLFSYATLYNGYTDTMDKMLERLKYDLKYIKDISFITDFKIIFLTSTSIIFGKKF